ncbi:MAG: ATP-binding protein [Pseudomonadota bacterium]
MSVRASFEALAPAVFAGVGGGLAHLLWGTSSLTAACAVLGAAAGAVLLTPTPVTRDQPKPLANATHAPKQGLDAGMLLDALPGANLLISEDRTIRHANADARDMFGLTGSEGMPVSTLRNRRLLDCIGNAFQERAANTLEFSLTRAGDSHLEAHVRPVGQDGEVLVAIFDQTTTHRAQESHRDFVANASHELKTPLAAVAGIIETLLGHAKNDPAATERFLNLLSAQTDRMTRLIQDLLSLNRIELNARVLPDEPQDLVGLLPEVIDGLRPIADSSGVTLVFEPPAAPVTALADRDEISQLFRNLIDNAIKYGGEGTDVLVTMVLEGSDDQPHVAVSVRDHGPGIAREHLPRLTERFYRVNVKSSRDKGGTGLGLSICKHVVSRHRGRLDIQSREGEGSIFRVELPVLPSGGALAVEDASVANTG